jgi:hypothetical protein
MTNKLTQSSNSLLSNTNRNSLKTLIPQNLRTAIENENSHGSSSNHPEGQPASSAQNNTHHHHRPLLHDVLNDVEKVEVENLCGMFGQVIKLSFLLGKVLLFCSLLSYLFVLLG